MCSLKWYVVYWLSSDRVSLCTVAPALIAPNACAYFRKGQLILVLLSVSGLLNWRPEPTPSCRWYKEKLYITLA